MPAFRSRAPIAAMLLVLALVSVARASDPSTAEARQAWQMLDYIAVDYAEAVRDGEVINAGEYAEMQEFSAAVQQRLQRLPSPPSHPDLPRAAADLQAAIERREAPAQVAQRATALANDVLAAFALGAEPASTPDLTAAAPLYATYCAACHGAGGAGDGPAAAQLDPPPIDFSDHARAAQRSPFALYRAITQGIDGTSMTAFPALSDAQRWSLAFLVGGMAYSAADIRAGEALWKAAGARPVADLAALSGSSEARLAEQVGAEAARALTAFLRSQPSALAATTDANSFALARGLLDDSLAAFAAGDADQARRLALAAYLDGVEPIEPMLAAREPELLAELESAMASLRQGISVQAPVADVRARHQRVRQLLARAEAGLEQSSGDRAAAFVGSFTILLREGLEALLIVIGMIAFLRKADRRDALTWVHAGWIGALLAGALTWVVATYLIGISGANREITEGLSSLLAALVLLSVGVWMHQKSLAGHWQAYLKQMMSAAMSRKSALFLFLLAFVAVYREVFETILFFAAMWSEQNSGAVIAGLVAGTAVLTVVAFWLLRLSGRLPIAQFFRYSAVLIAVLAVVLVGKGVAALQEAGWISETMLAIPRVEWLGIHPTWQVALAQLAVAATAIVAFVVNLRGGAVRQRA